MGAKLCALLTVIALSIPAAMAQADVESVFGCANGCATQLAFFDSASSGRSGRSSKVRASRLRGRLRNDGCSKKLEFGLVANSGDTVELTANAKARLCTETDATRLEFNGDMKAFSKGKQFVINRDLKADYDYYFGSKWLVTALLSNEGNPNYGLDDRTIIAPGVGLYNRPEWGYYSAVLGVTRTWENLREEGPASFAEAWAGTQVNWRLGAVTTLKQALDFFGRLEKFSDHRWKSETEIDWDVTERIGFSNALDVQWDNVPAPHTPKTNVQMEMNLVINFPRHD
jgi:putative salt-induced outer membrane protein YdiY